VQGPLLSCGPAFLLFGQLLPFDQTSVKDAIQDGSGQIWAITGQGQSELCRWQKNRWDLAPVPDEVKGYYPEALGRGLDGTVLCEWGPDNGSIHLLTWHKGLQSKVMARFEGPRFAPQLSLAGRNVWLTGEGKDIYRISSTGEALLAYSIAASQLHFYGRNSEQHNPVYATLDGRGRVWFWSNSLAGGSNIASIRGVLIHDGERFVHHPILEGVPDKKYSVIEKMDDRRMWLAVEEDGLYEIDIHSLTARRVPEPAPEAFRYVQRIFSVDEDWYVVSGAMGQSVPEPGGNGLSGVLWRQRDGHWQRIVNGIDKRVEYRHVPGRPWFWAEEGLWLGSFGSGPWFVPVDGSAPMHLDWRYGLRLTDTQRLFRLNDRMVLAIDLNRGTLAANIEDLLIAPSAFPRVLTLKPKRPLIRDARARIWGVLSTGTRMLSEWNGAKWLEHALPSGFDPEQLAYLSIDSRGRVWLVPDYRRGPAVIFDPGGNHSEYFDNYPMALQAQLQQPQGFRLGRAEQMVPSFSSDGRICFLDDWSKITYFDGRIWRKWGREHIKGDNDFTTDGPPFFNRRGKLSVNIEGKTWEFTESDGWHLSDYERGFGDKPLQGAPKPIAVPHNCGISNPESIVLEDGILYWLTRNGQLYRGIPGLCLSQFEGGHYHPFIDGRQILEAFTDRKGNTFLRTSSSGNEEFVVLFAQRPVPQTRLKLKRDSVDSVKVEISAAAKGGGGFVWRLDGGPWSASLKNSTLMLQWLPNGRHRFEAAAIEEKLQVDPSPAVSDFEVSVDPIKQVADIIAKLGSPEESRREAAVEALLRQPALALPSLEQARAKASGARRWWIEAAIQRIEEKNRSNP